MFTHDEDQMKKRLNIIATAIVGSAVFCCEACHASTVEDLASPSQGRRDAAAKSLRETYIGSSRTNWNKLVNSLELGTTATLVAKRFQASNFVAQAGSVSGNLCVQYRLDDLWVLDAWFTNSSKAAIQMETQQPPEVTPVFPLSFSDRALSHVELQERLRSVWVEPATNFTGIWRTYWVNGQPSHEISYKSGKRHGVMKTFHPDGSKSVISHEIDDGVPDGEQTAFYPTGQTRLKGQYKAGRQVGHWIWYKEDGSIESQKNYGINP